MKISKTIVAFAALILTTTTLQAKTKEISRDELKKALDANPDILIDVLKNNKNALFEIVNQAAQEEQARRQQEEEAAEKKEFEESFKSPKTPEINAKTRVRGDAKAKFTLVEYSDFQCPYCGKGFQIMEALRKKYGADIRFIFKNMPLPFHPLAMPAAQYLEAVAMQSSEKAWVFHDKLFQNQDKLSETFYKDTAKALGLNVKKLETDAKSQAVKDRIETDIKEAKNFGFNGTPGFLLNGIPVRGAYPVEFFESIMQRLDPKPQEQKN